MDGAKRYRNISIHALREEGDRALQHRLAVRLEISIHALREEGDLRRLCGQGREACISIHALREEGDTRKYCPGTTPADFYPRPPRGGRPTVTQQPRGTSIFLSTPSARRATGKLVTSSTFEAISIHALREEGDQQRSPQWQHFENFYPRPPRGGRPGP